MRVGFSQQQFATKQLNFKAKSLDLNFLKSAINNESDAYQLLYGFKRGWNAITKENLALVEEALSQTKENDTPRYYFNKTVDYLREKLGITSHQ